MVNLLIPTKAGQKLHEMRARIIFFGCRNKLVVEESLLNEQKLPNKVAHKEMHLVLFTHCEESIIYFRILEFFKKTLILEKLVSF